MTTTSVTRTVLVDATKLGEAGMDGTKRYVLEMLRAMAELDDRPRDLRIDVSLDGFHSVPLADVARHLTDDKVSAGLALGTSPSAVSMKQPIRGLAGL